MVEKTTPSQARAKHPSGKSLLLVVGLIAWVTATFIGAQYLTFALFWLLAQLGLDARAMNDSLYVTITTAIAWTIALVITLGGPYLALRRRTTLADVGLQRLPTWSEIGLAPAGYIISTVFAAIVLHFASQLIPGFDANQEQDVGFSNLVFNYEYVVAFVTLVVIAPFVEEIFFRGYLYGRLKQYVPTWTAIIIVSVLFAIAHGQANVAIMTFVMGIFLCLLRDFTGSLWPAIIMHMMRNGIAFFFLFVAPTLLIN